MSAPLRGSILVNSSPSNISVVPQLQSSSPDLLNLRKVLSAQKNETLDPSHVTAITHSTGVPPLGPVITDDISVIEVPAEATLAKPAKAPRKPRAKKLDANGNPIPPKPRTRKLDEDGNPIPPKPRARKLDADGNPMPPKPRGKKLDADGNPIPPKPRVPRKAKVSKDAVAESAESGDGSVSTKPPRKAPVPRKNKEAEASTYFADQPDTSKANVKKAMVPDDAPLNLETTIPRKTPWTPPPPDTKTEGSSSQHIGDRPGPLSIERRRKAKEVFQTLQSNFGCQITEDSKQTETNDDPVLKKRRLVEMISVNGNTAGVPASVDASTAGAIKAPRKKVSTLTELAVAQYDSNHVDLTFLAGYKDPGLEDTQPGHVALGNYKLKKKKKKEKPPDPALILHSPGTAMKQADTQDFVFGTSSQLVRDESPTFPRDLQAAIEQSRQMYEEEPTGWLDNEVEAPPQKTSRLWLHASRGNDGGFIDLRDDDDSMTSKKSERSTDTPTKPPLILEESPMPKEEEEETEFPDIDLILSQTPCKTKDSSSKDSPGKTARGPIPFLPPISSPPQLPIRSSPVRPHPQVLSVPLPGPTSPNVDFDMSDFDPLPMHSPIKFKYPVETLVKFTPHPTTDMAANLVMSPKLEYMTDAQLSSRLASFGFKAMKKRSDMISLLENCYSKRPGVGGSSSITSVVTLKSPFSTSSHLPVSNSRNDDSVSSIPAKRSRSRRGSTTSNSGDLGRTASVVEPPASPSTNPPSPKRGRGRPRKTPDVSASITATSSSSATKLPRKLPTIKAKVKTKTKTSPKKSPARKSPIRKSPVRQSSYPVTIEIPDSEDDNGIASPISSRHPTHETDAEDEGDSTISDNGYLEAALAGDETHVGDLSLAVDPAAEKRIMFNGISEAVQTAPRTRDPANPSWFDRILVYDPIAYEDLTVWLNTGQLERVGYDFEVSPDDVKAWCESKSICCVQRETRKGKERKRL